MFTGPERDLFEVPVWCVAGETGVVEEAGQLTGVLELVRVGQEIDGAARSGAIRFCGRPVGKIALEDSYT